MSTDMPENAENKMENVEAQVTENEQSKETQNAESEQPKEPTVAEQLAERTEDLQRLQAEYINYKKRVDRDRNLARKRGIESVMEDLLPTLDAIQLARAAGELNGGLKLIADELEKVTTKYGVTAYGEAGEPFDPQLHDALMTVPGTAEQTEALAAQIIQCGWKIEDKIVRHARVAVSEPVVPEVPVEAEENSENQCSKGEHCCNKTACADDTEPVADPQQ